MADPYHVFLSYSRNDLQAAALLRAQMGKQGLSVFKDDDSIREGDLWLVRLQEAVDACGCFIVLVGQDGVRRWIGAETQVALSRHFGPRDDSERLPIFPILLGDVQPENLPAFLRLFQATPWNGADPLPERVLNQIRERTLVANEAVPFEGCPFVGLDAYRMDQAQLFFGRQKETLDALACFDTRRGMRRVAWLEINGNSGSGKSSLMSAGLLPLVDQGWLWPRTGFEQWRRIGPMMPGEHPVAMLAEQLARTFGGEMADIRPRLEADERALAEWLRGRKQQQTAFLLAIDQFEELFTFAEPDERGRFDRLLAHAVEDADCPLFLLSTVRADFLDRFEELPRLLGVRNRLGYPWTLAQIGAEGLREVITGPARLAGLDVSEVREAMVAEAGDELGALPLVENALHWLWEKREDNRPSNRLSGRLFNDQGGLAGILSHGADDLLRGEDRDRALELLFRLVNVDPEGRRHTRRRIPLAEAVAVAGGGERGRALVNRLAGERSRDGASLHGPLRLITVTGQAPGGVAQRGAGGPVDRTEERPISSATADAQDQRQPDGERWVNLIHETLIRSKRPDAAGKPQPYWPTLWHYIEQNKERAARRERLQLQAREWKVRKGLGRLLGLAGWSGLLAFRRLAVPGSIEYRYLRWSRASVAVQAVVLAAIAILVGESMLWAVKHELPLEAVTTRWKHKVGMALPLPELVPISAGQFTMGRTKGDQGHPVSISQPFWLGATEVTFAQYDAFLEATGRAQMKPNADWGRGTMPVINVDWNDARVYAKWLGAMTRNSCRLPSEAEWEYACRAGTTTEYALPAPEGSDDIKGKGLANCWECGSEWGGKQTAPAGSFPANAWRLQDMHGNVHEWVEDCYDNTDNVERKEGPLGDKRVACGTRVLRGGSWYYSQGYARCADRSRLTPYGRNYNVGFRVLCSSPIVGH